MLRHIGYGLAMSLIAVPVMAQESVNNNLRPNARPQSAVRKSESNLSPALEKVYLLHVPATTRVESTQKENDIPNGLEEKIEVTQGRVVIDVILQGENGATTAALEAAGFKMYGAVGNMVSGTIPVISLQKIKTMKGVRYARPALRKVNSFNRANSQLTASNFALLAPVISQGDTALKSNIARAKYHVDGKGIKVGILSDSYNNQHGAQKGVLAGELPGAGNPFGYTKPVDVLLELDSLGSDEGRAMGEIVHDVAPGAELAFYSAFFGQASFASGILKLAAAGCQVIVDDIVYFAEPFFQDGLVAQAVDEVKSKGVTFFSAAGNQYDHSYESVYRVSKDTSLGADAGTLHNFSATGQAPRYYMPIDIPTGRSFLPFLQWDQSFYSQGGAGATSDLDLYLFDAAGNLLGGSAQDNLLIGDPVEGFSFLNRSRSTRYYIAIILYAGPPPAHIKIIDFDPFATFVATTPGIPGTFSSTIAAHANAAGAIATAAAAYYNTPAYGVSIPQVELFSSLGGSTIYLDKDGYPVKPEVRKKPEITAPDGGNTSFFSQDTWRDADTLPNFFGTSAAAPHAAGVAALMIQSARLGNLTPDQIKGVLMDKSIDMDHYRTPNLFDKGFDLNTGAGFIQADESVKMVRFPNVYIRDLKVAARCSDQPATSRKWQISNPNPFPVTLTWFITGLNAEQGMIKLSPGDSILTTKTYYLGSIAVPNVLVISWADNFGFPHFDTETSVKSACGIIALDSDNNQATIADAEPFDRKNNAAIFPNPVTDKLKVYLSFASDQPVNLELFSIDGKQLSNKVVASKGVYDMETSRYKPGLYLVKITQGNVVKTMKMVKK